MPDTSTTELRPLRRREAAALAVTENGRFVDLVRSLSADDWSKPTDCPAWDVRALTGHVLGMMEFTCSVKEFVHVIRAGGRVAGDRPTIDGMTEVQVAERSHLTVPQLVERLSTAAPRAARARRRLPVPLRQMPMPQEIDGVKETWRLGFLFDVVLTRDTWMHRIDVARATGHELVLTADHDGRLVADAVAEWARRHGQPFRLTLTGTAGGLFASGDDPDEEVTIDAVEFCRIISGRGTGTGLLGQAVPF
jgi:uncharacterized protein (TIGR03083 family)